MQQGLSKQGVIWLLSLVLLSIAVFINSAIEYDKGFNPADPLFSNWDMIWIYQEGTTYFTDHEADIILAGYPPGIFYVHQFANLFLGIEYPAPPAPYKALNFLLIIYSIINVGTALLLTQIGKRLHSPLLGIFLAALWAFSPLISERMSIILTETWQVFFVTLAAYTSLMTLQKKQARYAILSVLAGLGAILFKYTTFSALGFAVGATLWLMQDNWRKWGTALIVQIMLIIGCASWLFLGYGATDILDRPEANEFLTSGASGFNISNLFRIFSIAFQQVGFPQLAFGIIILVGGGFYLRNADNTKRVFYSLVLMISFFFISFILTYIVFWDGVMRYTASVSSLLVIVFALSLVGIVDGLIQAGKIKSHLMHQMLLASVLSLWLLPSLFMTATRFIERTKPFPEPTQITWMRDALPDATWILRGNGRLYMVYNELVPIVDANRPWITDSVTTRPLEAWHNINVLYADISDERADNMQSTDETSTLFDNILPLKHFPPLGEESKWRGESYTVYYLDQPDMQSDVLFGDSIHLIGYDISQENNQLLVRPFWQATQTPMYNYQAFVHVTEANRSDILTQADSTPALATYPTSAWYDPHEIIIGTEFVIPLPDDIDNSFQILLGLYDLETSQRLLTDDGSDFVELHFPTATDD